MPQFDSFIFLSEFFYLFLSFSFFYFYLSFFNKFVILRAKFFRKVWLFVLILRSKSFIVNYNKKLYITNIHYCNNKLFNYLNNKLNIIINLLSYIKLEFKVWFDFLIYILNVNSSFSIYKIISVFILSA
jgi:hypothetical protein